MSYQRMLEQFEAKYTPTGHDVFGGMLVCEGGHMPVFVWWGESWDIEGGWGGAASEDEEGEG